jgi:hypothetical protein
MRIFPAYGSYQQKHKQELEAWSGWLSEVTCWLWTQAVGPVLDAMPNTSEAVFVASKFAGPAPAARGLDPDPNAPAVAATRSIAYDRLRGERAGITNHSGARRASGRRLLSLIEPRPAQAPWLPAAQVEAAGFAVYAGLQQARLVGVKATRLAFSREAAQVDALARGLPRSGGPRRSARRPAAPRQQVG